MIAGLGHSYWEAAGHEHSEVDFGAIAEAGIVREACTVRSLARTGLNRPAQAVCMKLEALVPSSHHSQMFAHPTSSRSCFDSSSLSLEVHYFRWMTYRRAARMHKT